MKIQLPLLILALHLAGAEDAGADGRTRSEARRHTAAAKSAKSLLRPQPMRGPFDDLRTFCKALKPTPERCLSDAPDPDGNGFAALKGTPEPYRAVRMFGAGEPAWYGYYLGIQTERGWYVQRVVDAGADAKVRDLSLDRGGPVSRPLVSLRLVGANLMPTGPGSERTVQMCFEQLLLCGVGMSGTPSCLPSLRVANTVCRGYVGTQAMPPWDWQINATVRGEQLELAAQGTPDFTAPTEHLGAHPLRFP